MLEQFLLHLLKAKIGWITMAKIPVIAALLVLGTTGFVVTGTIQGDDDDKIVNLTIKPLETKKCVDALIAQTETLLELDVLAADATRQLRHLRENARESADDQNKLLDEAALRAQFDLSSTQIRDALSSARQDVSNVKNLDKCQDGNPDTTVDLDIADLRARYDKILRDFGLKLSSVLTGARNAFDVLVQNAPPKPPKQASQSSRSRD